MAFQSIRQSSLDNRHWARGFTIIEILVVLVIVGVMTAIAVPKYQKTVETAKADEAQTLIQLVYNANRMYVLNRCPTTGPNFNCYTAILLDLVNGGYVQDLNIANIRPYVYYAANDLKASNYAACAARRTGASPGTDTAPYNGWGYWINKNGSICGLGGAPLPGGAVDCPGGSTCP